MAQPNILLIVQDQLRYDVVADAQLCRTPALDQLAREGTAFSRFYTPTALCSPARSALLTGLQPHGTGVINNVHSSGAVLADLPRDVPTVAEVLAANGYRTGYVGKWHVGVHDGPRERGFADTREADPELWEPGNSFAEYWAHCAPDAADCVRTRPRPPGPRMQQRWPTREGTAMYSRRAAEETTTPAYAVCQSACDLIRTHGGNAEPFFVVASFLEPHWPNILPEPWRSMYDPREVKPWANFDDPFVGKSGTSQALVELTGVADFTWDEWSEVIAYYLGAVSYLDHLTGRIVATLDELGLADTTLVMVTTDHGDMTGSHRQFNKGTAMYEEIYHIPCIARWPGHLPAGTVSDALASHIDVAPTLFDAAGVASPSRQHGRSLLDLQRPSAAPWREALMCESAGLEFGLYSQRMIRRGDHKLIYNFYDRCELYDLSRDPHELDNLAYQPEWTALRLDLEAELAFLMADCDDPLAGVAAAVMG